MTETEKRLRRNELSEIGLHLQIFGGDALVEAIRDLGDTGLTKLSSYLRHARDYRVITFWGGVIQRREYRTPCGGQELYQVIQQWNRYLDRIQK